MPGEAVLRVGLCQGQLLTQARSVAVNCGAKPQGVVLNRVPVTRFYMSTIGPC